MISEAALINLRRHMEQMTLERLRQFWIEDMSDDYKRDPKVQALKDELKGKVNERTS